MVVVGLVGPAEIVAAGMDAAATTEAMLARLTDPEHRAPAMQGLFRALTTPTLTTLLADKGFAADLTPAFMRSLLADVGEIREGIADVSAKLDDIAGQSRETLEALALRFGEPEPEAMPLDALKAFLIEKAKDYRKLEAQVRALGDREGRIANLKAAAEEAVRALRLDEAKALIRDAIAVQRSERTLQALREDAALVETEAGIALLGERRRRGLPAAVGGGGSVRGLRPERAFRRRRELPAAALREHGLRYGGAGLARAVEAGLRNADLAGRGRGRLRLGDGTERPRHRAAGAGRAGRRGGGGGAARRGGGGLPRRAAGLHRGGAPGGLGDDAEQPRQRAAAQGARVGGEAGAGLLGEAVAAYRAALRVRTEAAHPVDWAMTQNNLGTALQAQGARVGGEAGAGLLGEAVAAYRAALRVCTEAAHPVDWATTQNNLGAALRAQGARVGGEAGAGLLGEAVAAYRAALRVYTEAAHPVDWAMTQNNLGTALSAQGERVGGEAGAGLLGEAVAAYRAALRVRTEAAHPVDWAMTQNNLGTALSGAGRRGSAGRRGRGCSARRWRPTAPRCGSAPRRRTRWPGR